MLGRRFAVRTSVTALLGFSAHADREGLLSALNTDNIMLLKIGIFVTGFLIVAQVSFWGNYLPLVYPVHLRGTGEGFAANVGGRMVGTAANALTTLEFFPMFLGGGTAIKPPGAMGLAAGAVAAIILVLAFLGSFFLPEPKPEDMAD